eukprot:4558471-Prymnesium_polylepis.1
MPAPMHPDDVRTLLLFSAVEHSHTLLRPDVGDVNKHVPTPGGACELVRDPPRPAPPVAPLPPRSCRAVGAK